MGSSINLGVIGIGKIARDQHLPAISSDPTFTLSAVVSRHPFDDESIRHTTLREMLESAPGLDAVSICTPPRGRHLLAAEALRAGKHVMLEKPPGATVSEVKALAALAKAQGRTLFATWHSSEAAGVAPARAWLADKVVRRVRVEWREDVRVWHPGQEWIFEAGGLGVFDPGINALSILARLLPDPMIVEAAELAFPENRAAPIAAELRLRHADAEIDVALDFLHPGTPCWTIAIETDEGTIELADGGSRLAIEGAAQALGPNREYPALYARFAELIASRSSDVNLRPLETVADAFLIGERRAAPAFSF